MTSCGRSIVNRMNTPAKPGSKKYISSLLINYEYIDFSRLFLFFIFRSTDSEWDQLTKFALRKIEKFVKTVAIELHVPSEETGENEVYAPRFLDEIADEIDTLENKKDTLFCEQINNLFRDSLAKDNPSKIVLYDIILFISTLKIKV